MRIRAKNLRGTYRGSKPMTTENTSSEIHARRIGIAAYLLLGLAATTPFLVGSLDGMSAFDTGRLLGQMAMAFVLAIAVLGLALRSRTLTTKSYGRLALSIGFLAWSATVSIGAWRDAHRLTEAEKELVEAFMQATVSATPSQPSAPAADGFPPQSAQTQSVNSAPGSSITDKRVAFMKGVQVQATNWATEAGALERRFAAIDLSDVLKPENLTSRPAIAAFRQKIRQMQALINERNAALRRYLADSAEYFRTVDIDEPSRSEATSSFKAGMDDTLNAYDELGTAQLASLQNILQMLDFAENNLGRTSVQDGQIMFQTQLQLGQYHSILASIQRAAVQEEIVTKKMTELQKTSRQSLLNEHNKN